MAHISRICQDCSRIMPPERHIAGSHVCDSAREDEWLAAGFAIRPKPSVLPAPQADASIRPQTASAAEDHAVDERMRRNQAGGSERLGVKIHVPLNPPVMAAAAFEPDP